jgi:predicted O-linked N-acetylglucosamine transferase (SPINDLY family)
MLTHDWTGIDGLIQRTLEKIDLGLPAASPFIVFSIPSSAAQHKRCAEIYTHRKYPPSAAVASFSARGDAQTRIRIGYFSGDFHEHPVARLTAGLFEHHDRSKFEVFGFSYGRPRLDAMETRLASAFDKFLDIHKLADTEIVALAREMEVDIAVDLTGFTGDVRSGIFAHRAAPVQISYLGYLGTMGAQYIDYLIADHILISAKEQRHYSEKIIYLPNSFQVNGAHRHFTEHPLKRREFDLPESGFVFCCFNNSYKITPEVFDAWMEILRRTNNTVLWLVADGDAGKCRLKNGASERNVNPDRIIFSPRVSFSTYLASYRLADLFLDTFNYSAGTTGSDALWAGLPLLTRLGDTFSSRVGASLLAAVGLPELIAKSCTEYVSMAVDFAKFPEKLAVTRNHLHNNLQSSPLFDTPRFTGHIDSAYTEVMRRFRLGLPTDHIVVRDISIPPTSHR